MGQTKMNTGDVEKNHESMSPGEYGLLCYRLTQFFYPCAALPSSAGDFVDTECRGALLRLPRAAGAGLPLHQDVSKDSSTMHIKIPELRSPSLQSCVADDVCDQQTRYQETEPDTAAVCGEKQLTVTVMRVETAGAAVSTPAYEVACSLWRAFFAVQFYL